MSSVRFLGGKITYIIINERAKSNKDKGQEPNYKRRLLKELKATRPAAQQDIDVTNLKDDSTDLYRKIRQDATVYQNLLFHIYMKLNMFRATHRPSSGA